MTACTQPDCQAPAVARVTDAQMAVGGHPALTFLIVRPAATPTQLGRFLCAEHCALAVDMLLMNAMENP